MKFLVLFLFFIPCVSVGFFDDEKDPFRDDANKKKFEGSILHLEEAIHLLTYSSKRDYPPAQKMLGDFNQDVSKIIDFINNYNEKMTRALFHPKITFLKLVQDLFKQFQDTEFDPIIEDAKMIHHGQMFSIALEHLTKGFLFLQELANEGYEPAKEYLTNIQNRIAGIMKKSDAPVFFPSEELNKRCKVIFSTYYHN